MSALEFGDGSLWLFIVAAGIGTFALRLSFVYLMGRTDEIPQPVRRVLAFVPPAVLSAVLVTLLVSLGRDFTPVYDGNRIAAAGVAAVVAWRTESMLATLLVGMGVLWFLQFVL